MKNKNKELTDIVNPFASNYNDEQEREKNHSLKFKDINKLIAMRELFCINGVVSTIIYGAISYGEQKLNINGVGLDYLTGIAVAVCGSTVATSLQLFMLYIDRK